MKATLHNARRVTVDGQNLYVAAICDERWNFTCRSTDVEEFRDPEEARAWLRAQAKRRAEKLELREESLV